MAVDPSSGTGTIWERGHRGLYADDHGVTVQSSARRIRRFAWAEISRFQDGGGYDSQSNGYVWALVIVLHTGQKVSAISGWWGAYAAEIAGAIRAVAERHGIPADVAGVPMKAGRPARRGLYHDPGGEAGLRYWDGTQWSPLMPTDIGRRGSVTLPQSPASWSALPTADWDWTYPAVRGRRLMVWSAVFTIVSAVLAVGALMVHRRWDHGADDNPSALLWVGAVVFAAWGVRALMGRRFVLKLGRAARRAAP
jgi:hypothetical protein